MTYQQQLHEARESERIRRDAATMKRNSAKAGFSNGIGGLAVVDKAGRYSYLLLQGSAETDGLIAQLLELRELQRRHEREQDAPAPTTLRGIMRDADDVLRGVE